jgi:hypothetical protein
VVAAEPAADDQTSAADPAQEPVPDPYDTLREMSGALRDLKRVTLFTQGTTEEVMPSGQKVELASVRQVNVVRPDKVVADVRGDEIDRRSVYDGKTLSILDRKHNVYAVIEAPGTIDALLDDLAKRYDMTVPLGDFFVADPYKALSSETETGQYIGRAKVGGTDCHHLAFTQAEIDWEIWIDASGKPLPKKLVITYKKLPGSPRYSVTMLDWNTDPDTPAGLFEFKPPEGAEEIDVASEMAMEAKDRGGATP